MGQVTDTDKPKQVARPNLAPSRTLLHFLLLALILVYGAIAGLRTVADFDLGWQMAEATHPSASTDSLSYTAPGAPWIYPPLAGHIFLALFHAAGYSAISYFCAAAVVLTLAILAAGSNLPTILLAFLATPLLASQMIPRSGLFTIILAAAFTRLLLAWYLHADRRSLWPLPLLMMLWVNLHTGFIAGIGLLLGYLAIETIDLLVPDRLSPAIRPLPARRFRQAAPWLTATLAATLVNPWGFRIYSAIAAQEHISKFQSSVVEELQPLYRSFPATAAWSILNPLDPLNAVWWLLVLSLLAIALLARRRRLGLAMFLACAVTACLMSGRSQGVFASVACLLGGKAFTSSPLNQRFPQFNRVRLLLTRAIPLAVVALVALVAWRSTNILTDRTSLREQQITFFGAGPSWWLPQQAADFIDQHHLPTQLFSTFNLSSYLTWHLGSHYRDFADGRYLPFGDTLVAQQLELSTLPLDAPEWQQASAHYNIRTVIFPLSRFFATAGLPLLEDCRSHTWSPVYLDTQAIVLVRNDSLPPGTRRLNCATQPLPIPAASSTSRLATMNRYQSLANAAVIYYLLGRNAEAQFALTPAQSITTNDESMELLAGQLQLARGETPAAEQSFRRALALRESDAAWYWLGMLYANQHRYPEAIPAMRNAARLSAPHNYEMEWALARLQILAGDEQAALHTLEVARSAITYPAPAGAEARAQLSDSAAIAYSQLSEWPAAIAAEENALREAPPTVRRWRTLSALYSAAGESAQAARARQQADSLSHTPN